MTNPLYQTQIVIPYLNIEAMPKRILKKTLPTSIIVSNTLSTNAVQGLEPVKIEQKLHTKKLHISGDRATKKSYVKGVMQINANLFGK